MDTLEPWSRREDDFKDHNLYGAATSCLVSAPSVNGSSSASRRNSTFAQIPGYTLMVAGQRSGKTSFLRLLLDTSNIAPTVSKEQLTSVARFVQGCSSHTTHIRHVSFDVILDSPDAGIPHPVTLTLIDTPSLDFGDGTASERAITDILRHVDSRFAESVEDEMNGNHHVHLCIYFLEPDTIVPPSSPTPPVLEPPRARTGSLSKPEQPIILEPPVATTPDLCRATLPKADITAIRRLSARVNVLPIVSRADILTNERLAAVKVAIRSDLADAGIGFGIFDLDNFKQLKVQRDAAEVTAPRLNGDGNGVIESAPSTPPVSPPSPLPPSFLKLPYALISADIYSHSEGLARPPPSREELVLQYTPSLTQTPISSSAKLTRGKFTRTFRWGAMDVLDPNHCDFIYLRTAIFHHMRTLQKYTKEYLFEKFRSEVQLSHRQAAQAPEPMQHAPPQPRQPQAPRTQASLPRSSRPILTIDTPPHPSSNTRHPSLVLAPPNAPSNGDMTHPGMMNQARPAGLKTATSSTKSQRTRSKKITVACNFCRSRKLKCDGGRPACGQCHKRSNPCDYIPHSKRRGAGRTRKPQEDESGSELDSGEEVEPEPSHSPEVPPPLASRANSNGDKELSNSVRPSNIRSGMTHPEQGPRLSPILQPKPLLSESGLHHFRPYSSNQDLPPIATLPVASTPTPSTENIPVLPPILIPEGHQQPIQQPQPQQLGRPRKRSSTTSGRGSRSHYASKIVACNFCRARKTRCDGEHPTCGACSRRSLPCNYVNDPGAPAAVKRKSVGDSPEEERPTALTSSPSPPGSSSAPGIISNNSYGYLQHTNGVDSDKVSKRGSTTDADAVQPPKKMRFGG